MTMAGDWNKAKLTNRVNWYRTEFTTQKIMTGRPMWIEEFETEKKWWNKRVENEHAWKVPVKQIKENNFNLDIKNPNTVDEEHGDPKELLKEYLKIEKEVEKTRNALKAELMAALGGGA